MVEAQVTKSHKDQGNAYFKEEMWLKAAACYTKGIKDTPEDAVLYRQATDQSCGVAAGSLAQSNLMTGNAAATVVQHC